MPSKKSSFDFDSKNIKLAFEVTIQHRRSDIWPVTAVLKSNDKNQFPLWAFGTLDLEKDWKQKLRENAFDLKEYGQFLGEALFKGEIQELFLKTLQDSAHTRFFLVVEDQALKSINWERLNFPDETGKWLSFAQDQRVLFSIYDKARVERYYPRFTQKHLKTLVVINSPDPSYQNVLGNEFEPFQTKSIAKDLKQIYENLPAKEVELSVLYRSQTNTWNALITKLNESHPQILHIVCHGCFFEDGIGSVLVFQEENKKLQAITVKRFIDDLKPISPLPHLIFLSSCDTANPQASTDVYNQFAQAIRSELGTPAVIAMSGKVSQSAAIIISKQFYPHLFRDPQVDIALSRAAFEINKADPNRFMPVLRQRLGHEGLFGLSNWNLEELNEKQIEKGINHLNRLMPTHAPAHRDRLNELTQDIYQENLQELDQFCHEVAGVDFATLAQDAKRLPYYDNRCPFPGMQAFRQSKGHDFRAFFFGRDREIREVVEKVENESIVAIVGSSGSGKSSLAFAGVLPTLEKKGWELLGVNGEGIRLQVSKAHSLEQQLSNALIGIDSTSNTVLYLDQFEQVYIGSDTRHLKQRKALFAKLLSLSETYPHLRVLITIRADYALEDAKKDLGDIVTETRYDLDVFSTQQLRSLAEQQVASVNLDFEEGLVHRIQSEVIEGQRGVLSLLQYLLWQLWQRRLGKTLRTEDYESLRGIQSVVTTIADRLFDKYAIHDESLKEYREAQFYLKNIFLRLTSPDKERKNTFDQHYKDIKQSVDKKSLYPMEKGAKPVIDKLLFDLSNERLISIDSDANGENQTVEIVHESLIQHWGKLNLWLSDAGLNSVRQGLMEAASVWYSISYKGENLDAAVNKKAALAEIKKRKNSQLVHTGTRLEDIENYKKLRLLFTSQSEEKYLIACHKKDELASQNREKARKSQRNTRIFSAVLSVMLLLAGGISFVAIKQKNTADDRLAETYFQKGTELRDGRNEYGQANAYFAKAVDRASYSNSSLAAYQYANDNMKGYSASLISQFDLGRVPRSILRKPNVILFDSDSRVLSWSTNGVAQVWDVMTGQAVSKPMNHSGRIRGATLFAKETRVLTWSSDGSTRIWDAVSGLAIGKIMRHSGSVYGATLFANETRILTWSGHDTAQVWDATTGLPISAVMRNDSMINRATLFANESRVLTWSPRDTTAQVWDAVSGLVSGKPMTHKGDVSGSNLFANDTRILTWDDDNLMWIWEADTGRAIFGPLATGFSVDDVTLFADDTRVLVWGNNGAQVWDLTTGRIVRQLRHLNDHPEVKGATIFANDTRVMTWGNNSAALIWDLETGKLIKRMKHESWLKGATLFANETRILTWSRDGSARVWDAITGKAVSNLMKHDKQIWSAAFFANDRRVLTWSEDGTWQIWDAETGRAISAPMENESSVHGAVVFAGNTRVLSVSEEGTARVWDIAKIREFSRPMKHDDVVNGATLFSDNTRVLTWSEDGTARVWDTLTGRPLSKFRLHEWRAVTGATLFANESKILTWSSDHGTARIWDTATGNSIGQPMLHESSDEGSVDGSSIFANESRILTWSKFGGARIWDASNGLPIGEPMKPESGIEVINIYSDDTWVLISNKDGTDKVLDVASGQTVNRKMVQERVASGSMPSGRRRLEWGPSEDGYSSDPYEDGNWVYLENDIGESPVKGHEKYEGSILFAKKKRRLIWSELEPVRIRDEVTGQVIGKPIKHDGNVLGAIIFANDTRVLTWAEDGVARVWDTATGQAMSDAMMHEGTINDVTLFAEGTRVLSWGKDGAVKVWDAATGKVVSESFIHEKSVLKAKLFDNDTRVLTWSEDGALYVRILPRTDLTEQFNTELRQVISSGYLVNDLGDLRFLSNNQIAACEKLLEPFNVCERSDHSWCAAQRIVWPFMKQFNLLPKVEDCLNP